MGCGARRTGDVSATGHGPTGRDHFDGGVARYRLRTTFTRHRATYVVLVVLIAAMGGIAMGAVAAARRTQSSYPQFLATTNASDLTLSTYGITNEAATNYSPKLAA